MGTIAIRQLKPDMVLSDRVCDLNGRLLMPKGEKIEERHIRILKTWGIAEVSIVGTAQPEESGAEALDVMADEVVQERLEHLFRHVDRTHPFVEALYRLVPLVRDVRASVPLPAADPDAPETGDTPASVPGELKRRIHTDTLELPELPAIAVELKDVIEDPRSSAENVARVVMKSPSLTARLLKIVNSSFYGFPSKIDNISRAVALIGGREVSSLALGISVIPLFQSIPGNIIDVGSFFTHSLAGGIVSRIIAARSNVPHTEQLFVGGLLHDIGRLYTYTRFPEKAHFLLQHCRTTAQLLYVEEEAFFGLSHARIGKLMLEKWKLPPMLIDSVCHHHQPSRAAFPEHAAIVHLADIIVNGIGLGSSGERCVPVLDPAAWDTLPLSSRGLNSIVQQTQHQLALFEHVMSG